MCRNAADPRPRRPARALAGLVGALALLAGVLLPAALAAETLSSPQVTGVEMTGPVRQGLNYISDRWIQWMTAWFAGNRPRTAQAVDELLVTARQLGMTRLPDLSFGALQKAVQAARKGEFAKAHMALEDAERLDPGRPETAFATMTVARLEGDYPGVLWAYARTYPRLLRMPLERYLWLQDLLVWGLCLLLLTGGLFIAVQMATKGRALFHDLAGLLGRRLPGPVALLVACLLLLWPLALPFGLLWLTLYWSVLLWGYASTSERGVMIALWLLLGVAPLLLVEQQRRVAVTLSPPARALQGLEQHRLYGGLFTDLGALRLVLPDSPAVKHMLADFHRSLNQRELARSLYRQVLEKEPGNTAALINLGAYYFGKGDFGSAIDHFQKAATADPQSAAAQFDLGQAFYESYLFDEAKAAQARAKSIDAAKVDEWIRHAEQQRIVTLNGGMARIPEIRRELMASHKVVGESSPRLELFRRSLSLLLAAGLLLLAITLHLARRPFGYGEAPPHARSGGWLDLWRRVLLPGVSSAESGEGGQGFLALLVPVALLTLPFFEALGYRIPWGYDPGNLSSWIVAILGLLLYLGARLRWELRNEV